MEPLATLTRARDRIREKTAAGLSRNILVLIRGGIYLQTEGGRWLTEGGR
jgi:hypothetical protein